MLEIFQYQFMQKAFLAGTFVAVVAPLVGLFLIVRRYSGLADTISHISLVGVATSLVAGLNPIPLSILFSVVATVFIDKLKASKKVLGESALAIFTYASLGLVSIIISTSKGFGSNLSSYLFGSVLTVTDQNLLWIMLICLVVLATIIIFYKKFFAISFDLELAKIDGVKVSLWSFILMSLACLVIATGIQVVGGLLIGAMMIIPATTSLQYKLSFKGSLILASIFSLLSVWIGLFVSFYFNLPSGGAIVLVNMVFFGIGLVVNRVRV
jgi:zinc transport system permease protein